MTVRIQIAGQEVLVEVKDMQGLLALRQDLQKATHHVEECIDDSVSVSPF